MSVPFLIFSEEEYEVIKELATLTGKTDKQVVMEAMLKEHAQKTGSFVIDSIKWHSLLEPDGLVDAVW